MDDLVSAASSGDRVATLRALRDLLAKELADCASARDIAALSRQLTDVLGQLEAAQPPAVPERTPLDELANRRGARSPRAARQART